MKSILLASVASVAFAGVAAAEITFSGSAALGYNDTDHSAAGGFASATSDVALGFYGDLSLSVGLSQELDNGLTVAASIDLADVAGGASLSDVSYELSLTSETAGLYVGDTNNATEALWSGPSGMDVGFAEDNVDVDGLGGSYAIRGEASFGGVKAAVSYSLDGTGAGATNAGLVGLQVAAAATFGSVNVGFGYTEAAAGVTGQDEVFGLSVGTSFGGADVSLGYAQNNTTGDDSTAIGVSYPVGPVTLGAYYGMNTAGDAWGISAAYANGPVSVSASYDVDSAAVTDWALEGSYDIGNGAMAYAGVVDAGQDFYVAGSYDLGGGAALLVSYVEDGDADSDADEIGANAYQVGTTVEVSFSF